MAVRRANAAPAAAAGRVPEFRSAVAAQEAFLQAVPELRVSHDRGGDEVDECLTCSRRVS